MAMTPQNTSQAAKQRHAAGRQDEPKPGHVRVANIGVDRPHCVAYVPQADGIVIAA